MGVTNLWQILAPVQQHQHLDSLRGQVLAVDLSVWVCETQAVKQMQGVVTKPFLRNLFFRISHLTQLRVKLVFAIEGDAPEMKVEVMCKRQQGRSSWRAKGAQGSVSGNKGRQKRSHFKSILKECCQLLDYLGIPYVQSHGEAEAMCAMLNAQGIVDGVLTDDSDAFLYGAKRVYRHFTMNSKDPHIESLSMADIESRLGLDREKLVSLSLFLGCDFLPKGVPGVGVEKAVKLLQTLKDCDVLSRIKKWRHMPDTDCFDAIEAGVRKKALAVPEFPQMKVVDEYLVTKDKCPGNLKWRRPTVAKVQAFALSQLEWPVEYTLEKVLPLVTLWDMIDTIQSGYADPTLHLVPSRIVKPRVRQGVACFEVEWHKPVTDLDTVGDYYTTVEVCELFTKCHTHIVNAFQEQLAMKNTKKTRKRGKKADKPVDTTPTADECDGATTPTFHTTELGSLKPVESLGDCIDLSYLLGALSLSSDKCQETIGSSDITAGTRPPIQSCAPTCYSESEQPPGIVTVQNSNMLSHHRFMVMSANNASNVNSGQNGARSCNNFDAPTDDNVMKLLLTADSNMSPVIPLQSRTVAIKYLLDGDSEIVLHSHVLSPKLTITNLKIEENVNGNNEDGAETDEAFLEDSILDMLQAALKHKKPHGKKNAQRKKVTSSSKSPVVVPNSDCNLLPLEQHEMQTKILHDVNNSDVQNNIFLQEASQSSAVHNDHLLPFGKNVERENGKIPFCNNLEIAALYECVKIKPSSPAHAFKSPQRAHVDICTSNIGNKSNAFIRSTNNANYMDNDSVFSPADIYHTSNNPLHGTSFAEFGNFSLQSSLLNNFSIASESPKYAEKSSVVNIRHDHNNHEQGCSSPVVLENNVYEKDHNNLSFEGTLELNESEIGANLRHLADDLTTSINTKDENFIKGSDTYKSNCQDSNPCYETLQSIHSDNSCNRGLPHATNASRLIGPDNSAMTGSACSLKQKTYDASEQIGFAKYAACKWKDEFDDKENCNRREPAAKLSSSQNALQIQCTNSKVVSASMKGDLSMHKDRLTTVPPLHLRINAKSSSSKDVKQTKRLTQREYLSCSDELTPLHSVGTINTSSSCVEETANSPVSLADRLRQRLKASSTMSILKRMTTKGAHSQN